jgi:hypothetical protein
MRSSAGSAGTAASLAAVIADRTSFADFIAHAPALNPARALITGVVCGVRVEEIEEQPMREIRYLDKLVDELAEGKVMGKIVRGKELDEFSKLHCNKAWVLSQGWM